MKILFVLPRRMREWKFSSEKAPLKSVQANTQVHTRESDMENFIEQSHFLYPSDVFSQSS